MVLIINEVDFRPYLKPQGFKWKRQDREGENTMTAMNGEEIRDRLAIKAVLEVSLRAVPLGAAKTLPTALEPEYVPVVFTDPSAGGVVAKVMKVTSVPSEYITERDGEDWYGGISFQLTER